MLEREFGELIGTLGADPFDELQPLGFIDDHTAVVVDENGDPGLLSSSSPVRAAPGGAEPEAPSTLGEAIPQAGHHAFPDEALNQPLDPESAEWASGARSAYESGRALDLALEESEADFKPRSPLVPTTIPGELSRPAILGEGPDAVAIEFAGAAGAAGAELEAAEAVSYHAIETDTDLLVAPTATGLESLYHVRSEASPETFSTPLDLPEGTELQATRSGSVEAVRDGSVLLTVMPPAAVDADGRPVAATVEADGQSIEIRMSHRGAGLTYPVLLDPSYAYLWSSQPLQADSFTRWQPVKVPANSAYQLRTTCDPSGGGFCGHPRGLFANAPAGTYAAASSGFWRWQVPRYPDTTAWIAALNEYPATFTRNSSDLPNSPYAFTGIFNPAQGWVGATSWSTPGTISVAVGPGTGGWSADPQGGKEAHFGVYSSQLSVSLRREAILGGVGIVLKDPEAPGIALSHDGDTSASGPYDDDPDRWFDSTGRSLTASIVDPGLGVAVIARHLLRSNGQLGYLEHKVPSTPGAIACTGGRTSDPATPSGGQALDCPKTAEHTFAYATKGPPAANPGQEDWFPEGVNMAVVSAADPLGVEGQSGHGTYSDPQYIKIDRTKPVINEVSGSLKAGTGRSLHVAASDGSRGAGDIGDSANWPAARSGVKSIALLADGKVVDKKTWPCEEPLGSCARSRDFTLDSRVGEGAHAFTVLVRDHAGHQQNQQFTASVPAIARSTPAPHRQGLEQWFDYDSVETGLSGAHVNMASGNLTWHKVPMVNPGRGLSSVLNLTYNAHDFPLLGDLPAPLDSRFLNLDYDEAGPGFSMAISGLTRINEPLGGVLIPSLFADPGDVTLTDPDGTMHTFKPKLEQTDGECLADLPIEYQEPPGVNLRLRRFGCLEEGLLRAVEDALHIGETTAQDLANLRLDEFLPPRGDDPRQTLEELAGLSREEINDLVEGLYVLEQPKLWAITRPDGVTYYFNGFGFATSIEDRNGNVIEFEYEKVNPLGEPCVPFAGQALPEPPILPPLCEPRLERVVDASGNDQDSAPNKEDDPDRDARSIKLDYYELSDYLPALDIELFEQNGDPRGIGPVLSDLRQGLRVPQISDPIEVLYSLGKVESVTDHGGRELGFDYDRWGRLEELSEAAGSLVERATSFDYDSMVQLDGLDLPLGVGPLHPQVSSITDPRGASTAIEYEGSPRVYGAPNARIDAGRRVERVINRAGRARSYIYTPSATSTVSTATDARGTTAEHVLDGADRPTQIKQGPSTASRQVNLTWDADNNVTQMTEAAGSPEQAITKYEYNANGALTRQTDPANRVTTLVYCDHPGTQRAAAVDEDDGVFVSDLTAVVRPEGQVWRTELDGLARSSGEAENSYCARVKAQSAGAKGRATAQVNPLGHKALSAYDSATGVLTAQVDREGGRTEYRQHDRSGLPQVVIDPEGFDGDEGGGEAERAAHRWAYTYDAVGNTTSVTDPRGSAGVNPPSQPGPDHIFTTTLGYDALDRLTTERLPKDSRASQFMTRIYGYDANDNQTRLTDGNGATSNSQYNAMDRVNAELSPSVPVAGGGSERLITRYAYDAEQGLVEIRSPAGSASAEANDFETDFVLDALGRRVVTIQRAGAEPVPSEAGDKLTSFTYDRRDNVIGILDPRRNGTRTPQQAAEAVRLAASGASSERLRQRLVYDAADQLLSVTEEDTASPNHLATAYEYDPNGNRSKVTTPGANSTTMTYDDRDLLVSSTDQLGDTTSYGYDKDGRIASEEDPRGPSTGTAGDYTTAYTYDANGELIRRTIPWAAGQYAGIEGKAVAYQRNAVGDPVQITDARGNSFTNDFLDTGDLMRTGRPSWWDLGWGPGAQTPDPGRRYAASGDAGALADLMAPQGGPRLTEAPGGGGGSGDQIRAPEGPPPAGAGDLGRLRREPLPTGLPQKGSTSLAYDNEMRLTGLTDTEGASRSIDYDGLGRITQKRWPFPGNNIVHAYEYDRNSNIAKFTDGEGQPTTYSYDQLDRRILESAPGSTSVPGGPEERETTTFTYTRNGNLLDRHTPRGNHTFSFTWDSLDRLTAESNPLGNEWDYRYDSAGNLDRETSPRGFHTDFRYDGVDRLERVIEAAGTSVARETCFGYDPAGNRDLVNAPGAQNAAGTTLRRISFTLFDARDLTWKATDGVGIQATSCDPNPSLSPSGLDLSAARTTISEFDPNGNLRRTVNPAGVSNQLQNATPEVAWDGATNPANASHHATVAEYSPDNLVTKIHLPHASEAPSDAMDGAPIDDSANAVNQTAENAKRYFREFQYDARGHVNAIAAPRESGDAVFTTYQSNALGWVTKATNPRVVDEGDSPLPADDRLTDKDITFAYDRQGNQTLWRTDAKTTVGVVNPPTPTDRRIEYGYHPSGLLASRKGVIPSGVSGPDSNPDEQCPTRRHSYFYNKNRSLVRVDDRNWIFDDRPGDSTVVDCRRNNTDISFHQRTLHIARDGAERERAVEERWQQGRDTRYTYDADGNVTRRETDGEYDAQADSYSGGKPTNFTYDALGRETRTEIGLYADMGDVNLHWDKTYHPSGEIATLEKSNGVDESYAFRADGLIASRKVTRPGSAPSVNQSYDYDENRNRSKDERGLHGYNARSQLVRWDPEGANTGEAPVSYVLDGSGQIRNSYDADNTAGPDLQGDDADVAYRYTNGGLGPRLRSRTATLPGQPDASRSTYFYDDIGNTIKIRGQTSSDGTFPDAGAPPAPTEVCNQSLWTDQKSSYFCFDEFSRLVSSRGAEKPDGTDRTADVYLYDGLDRRAFLSEPGAADPYRDRYYVGTTELLSSEERRSGTEADYHYDSEGRRLGQNFKPQGQNGEQRFYASDANGSVSELETKLGAVSGDYDYDPYGGLIDTNPANNVEAEDESTVGSAGSQNPFRFEGFYYDSGIQSYDMFARQYRPEGQRFLSEDRFAAAGADLELQSDPLTQNRYVFAGGNPVSRIEWDGHRIECHTCTAKQESKMTKAAVESGIGAQLASAAADTAQLRSELGAAMRGESGQRPIDLIAPLSLDFAQQSSSTLSEEKRLEAAALYDELFGLTRHQEERLSRGGTDRLGPCPPGYSNLAICSPDQNLNDAWTDFTWVTGGVGGSLFRGGRGVVGALFGSAGSGSASLGIREVARQWLFARTSVGTVAANSAPSLRSFASEVRVAGLHPAARNNRTIAVGIDREGRMFAGSSSGFDAGQRAALERLGITRVPGSGSLHAEEELLRGSPVCYVLGRPCAPHVVPPSTTAPSSYCNEAWGLNRESV